MPEGPRVPADGERGHGALRRAPGAGRPERTVRHAPRLVRRARPVEAPRPAPVVPQRRSPRARVQPGDANAAPRLGARSRTLGVGGGATAIALGVLIVALAVLRDRPDELIAGVFAILVAVGLTAWVIGTRPGRAALPTLAAVGWAAQAAASMLYYYTDFAFDAELFHTMATSNAASRTPVVFPTRNWGNEGVTLLAASVYRVTGPSMLLGFLVFAAMALAGKVLFARAALSLLPLLGRPAEWLALGAVLLPSFVWWTAAISKESVVVLGMGLVFAALFRPGGTPPSVVGIVAGLAIITLVRAHVTLLLAAAVMVYLFFAFQLPKRRGGRRLWLLALGLLVVFGGLVYGARYLGADGLGGLEDVRIAESGRTSEGGSTIVTRPIRTPLDIPLGVYTLLFRPTLWEFFSLITFAQALESTLLAVLLVWIVRQGRRRRQHRRTGFDAVQVRAIRMFGWAYTAAFIYTFSGIAYNLGLISRQRAQLWMPLLLVLAAALVRTDRRAPSVDRAADAAGVTR